MLATSASKPLLTRKHRHGPAIGAVWQKSVARNAKVRSASDDDEYGSWGGQHLLGHEVVSFITQDGIVRLSTPSIIAPRKRVARPVAPMPSWEEQKLCIGASFNVAATNGHDPARRIQIAGFCQSVDLLYSSVEDTVLTRGGEVLETQRELRSGLHEVLSLTVAIPLLWGVPPTLECLKLAIKGGGGIVDRVRYRWDIYPN